MSVAARTLIATLDAWLNSSSIEDFPGAFNGIQLEPPAQITTVASAVDACAASARAAAAVGADLLLVHHGLLWDAPYRLIGHHYEMLATLIRAGCGVYSSHLPLDAHPELGNNAILANRLGMSERQPFGSFRNTVIGVIGTPVADTPAKASVALGFAVEEAVPAAKGGHATRLAVVSGGAASMLREAHAAGADALLTGEAKHHDRVLARDLGIGLWLGGHYQTETVGVRALGERLAAEFGIRHIALDLPTGG